MRKELLGKEQQIADLTKEVDELSGFVFTTRELREKLDELETTARNAKEMELKLKAYEYHEFNLEYMKERVKVWQRTAIIDFARTSRKKALGIFKRSVSSNRRTTRLSQNSKIESAS